MTDLPGRPSRRTFLKTTAFGAALSGLPMGAQAEDHETPPVPLTEVQTEFFTAEEWAFVLAATARLIPSEGEGPGALEARVPVFIDRQLAGEYGRAEDWYMEGPHDPSAERARGWQTPLSPADTWRQGIQGLDAWCRDSFGADFASLEAAQQDAALTALQNGEAGLAPELSEFWGILLGNTREGYFSDPMYGGNHRMQSWVHIGFPGARAAYTEWVGRHNIRYPLGPVSISGERA